MYRSTVRLNQLQHVYIVRTRCIVGGEKINLTDEQLKKWLNKSVHFHIMGEDDGIMMYEYLRDELGMNEEDSEQLRDEYFDKMVEVCKKVEQFINTTVDEMF